MDGAKDRLRDRKSTVSKSKETESGLKGEQKFYQSKSERKPNKEPEGTQCHIVDLKLMQAGMN